MSVVFLILSIYSISFFLRESELLDVPRNWLMSKSPWFYKLFQCYYCLSTHAGWISYLLFVPSYQYNWRQFIIWTLASGSIGLILNGVVTKIYKD